MSRNEQTRRAGASGALIGDALFVWQMNVPYVLSGGLLVAIAVVIAWKAPDGRRAAPV